MDPSTVAILATLHSLALVAMGLARYALPSLAAMAGAYVMSVLIMSL